MITVRSTQGARVALATLLLAACSTSGSSGSSSASTGTTGAGAVVSEEYLPGLEADLYRPAPASSRSAAVPLVVMIPGGGWVTADPRGLIPLAEDLATHGIAVVTTTIRGASNAFRFPGPVQDVLCALDSAVALSRSEGLTPGPVVLMGHSSGAHLAALAGLGAVGERGDCPHPPTQADALALLSGIYDPATFADVAEPLFGTRPTDDPARWRSASAYTWITQRPTLPVFLAHGDHDQLVPTIFTKRFATALEQAGHPVRLDIVAGADHFEIYSPASVGAALREWVTSLG
jgi:acetyl esterase/lipase